MVEVSSAHQKAEMSQWTPVPVAAPALVEFGSLAAGSFE